MDEARYLAETVPVVLLEFLRSRLTDKQLRLFAAACHPDEKHWQEWASGKKYDFPTFTGEEGALYCVGRKVGQNHAVQLRPAEKARRADILRDIAGPFDYPNCFIGWEEGGQKFCSARFTEYGICQKHHPIWLTPAVVALARGILRGREVECPGCGGDGFVECVPSGDYGDDPLYYPVKKQDCPQCHGRGKLPGQLDWEGLPLLGDLLQENGCEVPEVIAHCYTDKPHCRECWLIELLIGGDHA